MFEGLRPGEILALHLNNVFEAHIEIVRRVYKDKFDTPKGRKGKRTQEKQRMGCPNRDEMNGIRQTDWPLEFAAATARRGHWRSIEARRKAWVRGHAQVIGDVRFGGDPVQEFAFFVTSGRRF